MDERGELTIAHGDARLPLHAVQAVVGEMIGRALDLIAEDRQAAVQTGFASILDSLMEAARPALPGERVLSGDEAIAAARAAVSRYLPPSDSD